MNSHMHWMVHNCIQLPVLLNSLGVVRVYIHVHRCILFETSTGLVWELRQWEHWATVWTLSNSCLGGKKWSWILSLFWSGLLLFYDHCVISVTSTSSLNTSSRYWWVKIRVVFICTYTLQLWLTTCTSIYMFAIIVFFPSSTTSPVTEMSWWGWHSQSVLLN